MDGLKRKTVDNCCECCFIGKIFFKNITELWATTYIILS